MLLYPIITEVNGKVTTTWSPNNHNYALCIDHHQQQPSLLIPSKLGYRPEMKPAGTKKIETKTKVKKRGEKEG
jgi:hypothetical protein